MLIIYLLFLSGVTCREIGNHLNKFKDGQDAAMYFDKKIHDYEKSLIPEPVLIENWPNINIELGQVTAVSLDPDGNPVIFHRGSRIWDAESFNETEHFQFIDDGPIKENTIYKLNSVTGEIEMEWGNLMFYMPHGMTIDKHGNFWITDVAMHQVFKFKPYKNSPILTLGTRFQPGLSSNKFCKPTAVAVASTEEFFVADGYCNQRIMKYNAGGTLIQILPHLTELWQLRVPHGITLIESKDLVCVADRENKRIVCFKAGLQSSMQEGFTVNIIRDEELGRVYDIEALDEVIFGVATSLSSRLPAQGFTFNPILQSMKYWGNFSNPHSIAVCANKSALYVTEISPNRVWKYSFG